MSDLPSSSVPSEPSESPGQRHLPVTIHPDDAKDKVFTAILKALSKMGNKPSSPKELANIIIKYKYATLGGATPFATVSSRISQHFKRAAEHNPPRPPLLARHIDEHHSRKISYSLATDSISDIPSPSSSSRPAQEDDQQGSQAPPPSTTQSTPKSRPVTRRQLQQHAKGAASEVAPTSSNSDSRKLWPVSARNNTTHTSSKDTQAHSDAPSTGKTAAVGVRRKSVRLRAHHNRQDQDDTESLSDKEDDADDESEDESPPRSAKRTRLHPPHMSPSHTQTSSPFSSIAFSSSPFASDVHPESKEDNVEALADSPMESPAESPAVMELSDEESEAEYSDYYEEMMKGDEAMANIEFSHRDRRRSSVFAVVSRRSSVVTETSSSQHPRRPSYSYQYSSTALLGGEDIWTPYYNLDQDIDSVLLLGDEPNSRAVDHLETGAKEETSWSAGGPAAPFPNSTSSRTSRAYLSRRSSSAGISRKSFSGMVGSKETSLLQKALLASTARGMAKTTEVAPPTSPLSPVETTHSGTLDLDVDEDLAIQTRPRRKSWPDESTTSGTWINEDDEEQAEEASVKQDTVFPTERQPSISKPGTASLAPNEPQPETATAATTTTATTATAIASTSAISEPIDAAEVFVQFEDDEDKKQQTPSENTNTLPFGVPLPDTKDSTLSDTFAASQDDLAVSRHLATFQQMAASIPGLSHLSGPELAKSLSASIQPWAKSGLVSTPPPSGGDASSPQISADLRAVLARFPSLEALIPKDASPGTLPGVQAGAQASTPAGSPSAAPVDPQHQQVVHPIVPTHPPMYIAVVDQMAVCVAVLEPTDTTPECRVMRRLDTGYVNGTMLLTAGGVETESERNMILSFELDRVRMPKRMTQLTGTWIPLHRAQALAATCSIQHRLGSFLSESIEHYFPSPLPITVPVARRLPTEGRLAAMAMAAHTNKTPFPAPLPIARPVSPPTRTTSAAQLHQLLSSGHRNRWREYALKAPLLGTFDDANDVQDRKITVIEAATSRNKARNNGRHGDAAAEGSVSSDEDTDSDTEVEQVRQRMRKMRDAAVDAMATGSSFDLEELLQHAQSPIVESPKQPAAATYARFHRHGQSSRRRPVGSGKSTGGKISPSALKKSASWSGALASSLKIVLPVKKPPTRKPGHTSLAHPKRAHQPNNPSGAKHTPSHVVSASTTSATTPDSLPAAAPAATTIASNDALTTIQEDDEDEEIDIGGSDRDDDLR